MGRVWAGLRLAGPGFILGGSGECSPSVRHWACPHKPRPRNEAPGVMTGVDGCPGWTPWPSPTCSQLALSP